MMKSQSTKPKHKKSRQFLNRLVMVFAVGLFAVIGIILQTPGLASNASVSIETETGILEGSVAVITDEIASGGKAIRFSDQTSNGNNTGGSGGLRTDRINLSYTANGITSKYHLYAGGLDWAKQVGVLMYGDGSGEFGLKNVNSTYLLAGTNGMINVAKRNNMILLTPLAPGDGCPDGDGTCWYQTSSGITATQKTQWAEALLKHVHTQYPLDLSRVAFGGYSSGAQMVARYWIPSGAAQRTMADGVIVSISCGGNPAISQVAYTSSFKSNVHMNWNSGDNDASCPHTATWSTNGGYTHYTNAGFKTSRDLLPGVTHNRSGAFGGIMDAQIKEHVKSP